MKHTDYYTIGRDTDLTLAVLQGIRLRHERTLRHQARWRWATRWLTKKETPTPTPTTLTEP